MQALFKARFEQALESQKLNIKKIEQDLRRKGVNPDDPVAMASIQRVASTFFNAIDKREGSPYVFREDKSSQVAPEDSQQPQDAGEDSDQEELDRFIAEIEDAADKEWAEEESAEKEELDRIRYWNREDFSGRHRNFDVNRNEDSNDETRDRMRYRNQRDRRRASDSEVEGDDELESDDNGDVDHGSCADDSDEALDKFSASNVERRERSSAGRANSRGFGRNEIEPNNRKKKNTASGHASSEMGDAAWDSEGEGQDLRDPRASNFNYRGSTDDENFEQLERHKGSRGLRRSTSATLKDNTFAEDWFSEAKWESGASSGEDS